MSATPSQGPGVRSSLALTLDRRAPLRGRVERMMFAILFMCAALFAAGRASAAVITYELTPDAGNRWIYQYTVSAAATDPAINELTIFFDATLYANLLLVSAPSDWDALTIDPDPGLPADGFFDALALVTGIAPGASLGGFAVSFEFLGNGRPGSQGFDIVDPLTFATISSGITRLDRPAEVPEPASAWLLAAPLLLLLRSRSRFATYRTPTHPID